MKITPLIVALDFPNAPTALSLASQLNPQWCHVKVGKELFTAEGPAIVEQLQKKSFRVFLDLKFHDIPNTVAQACRSAAAMGVWMVNVHALGGAAMLEAAATACAPSGTILIAVTILTSLQQNDLAAIGLGAQKIETHVQRLAVLASENGCHGVVCSPHEATVLKEKLSADFLAVTPGIRPFGTALNDQQRITTPTEAITAGSDYLVIGRPITQAENPSYALEQIYNEIKLCTSQ